jgi:hypothetical protein
MGPNCSVREESARAAKKEGKKQNLTREILKNPLAAARRAIATASSRPVPRSFPPRRRTLSPPSTLAALPPPGLLASTEARHAASFQLGGVRRLVVSAAPRRRHPRPASAPSVGWTSLCAWNRSLSLLVRNPSLSFSFYSTGSLLPLYYGQSSSNLSRLKSQ